MLQSIVPGTQKKITSDQGRFKELTGLGPMLEPIARRKSILSGYSRLPM